MTIKKSAWTKSEQNSGQKTGQAWERYFKSQSKSVLQRGEEIAETARITESQCQHENELLGMDNVVGVAAGLKMCKGVPVKQWSMLVLVDKKRPKADLSKASMIPAKIDGVATDVVEVGTLEPLVFNARVRPALPGFSIGHHNITAGTFGCLVQDVRRNPSSEDCPSDYLVLSNNHVLAAENQAAIGDLILQPGPFDGGVFPADGIATLDRFEPIIFGFPGGYNLVDAAVACSSYSRNVTSSIIGLVTPRGIDQVFIGSPVLKVGRTTEVTTGSVLAVNATVNVGYSQGIAQFRHQILTSPMAAGGDSGSLLMDFNLNAVGLLFAGSPFVTIHNHITDVEIALGVRPVTTPRTN